MRSKGYWELLVQNDFFRRLYLARQISLLGDWFALLAILAILRSIGQESASSFGIALVLKNLPSLFVTPWAGFFADRYDRLTVMIVSDIFRFLLVLCFFLVLIWPSAWIVYGVIILQSISSTFFEPAKSALLPNIVDKEDIATANALGAASWSIMLSVGVLVGGICTEYFGWKIALAIDACTYLISIVFLLRITAPKQIPVEGNIAAGIGEAWRYMTSNFSCWSLVLVKACWNLVGAVTLMLTILGENLYDGVFGVSILYCARGIGTGIGPVVARLLSQNKPEKMDRLIFWGFVCGSIFYLPMFLFSEIWYFVPLIAFAHLGGATVWVFSTVRLQQTVPEHILGRIFAFEYAAWTLMFVLSTTLYSWFVDVYSTPPQVILSIMGVTLIIPALGWWMREKFICSTS
jgi:MFS family permease